MAARKVGGDIKTFNSTNSRSLCSVLQLTMDDIEKELCKPADDEKSGRLQHLKEQCYRLLQSFQQPGIVKSSDLKSSLRDTASLLLDFTYLNETQLVDSSFPADSADTMIASIQESLDRIFHVTKATFPDGSMVEVLGEELVECVHWRKGGLMYMFCHTVESDCRKVDQFQYKQCLEDGILELDRMLSTRTPVEVSNTHGADDTLQLFNKGAYSDVHLLAKMYAAEMCYWQQQAMDKGKFTPDPSTVCSSLNAKELALRFLESYLSCVRGPLRGQGWETGRAEEIILYFTQNH